MNCKGERMPEIWFPHLNIQIMHLDRVCFSIFGFDVYWYGVLIASAFLLGIIIAGYNAKRVGVDEDIIYDFMPFGIISAIIGARLYYVIFSWSYYKNHLGEIFSIRDGGLGIYGGIILGTICLYIFSRYKKVGFMRMCDIATPSVALGQAIGRWGNFFNKEAFGAYTDNPFAMRIRTDVASFVPQGMPTFDINGSEYIQVHPTFLYESTLCFLSFCILMYLYKKKKFEGHIFLLYVVIYGVGRFFIESLRQDQLIFMDIPISMAVSLVGVLVALSAIFIISAKQKEDTI